jgi:predicted nucleic acid-binding protein
VQPCVIDTCSFLHAFQTYLGRYRLIDLVGDHFDVIVHNAVLQESVSALKKAYPQWKLGNLVSEEFSEIRRLHAVWVATRCSNADVERESKLLTDEGVQHLDRGELECIALAIRTADERMRYVLFLTDDYEAGEAARGVFDKYQCGFVLRNADLIVFFGIRFNLGKSEIHHALRDLISFNTELYESLSRSISDRLVSGRGPFVVSLIRSGDFARAKKMISTLSLDRATSQDLNVQIDELIRLARGTSVLAHCLMRLRQLEKMQLPV